MNLQAIEAVVRRLFSDVEFRARAIAEPGAALSEYGLADEERAALTKLCTQLAIGTLTVAGFSAIGPDINIYGCWW